jgi:hypothetical protein
MTDDDCKAWEDLRAAPEREEEKRAEAKVVGYGSVPSGYIGDIEGFLDDGGYLPFGAPVSKLPAFKPSNYNRIVPKIETIQQFLEINQRSAARGKLVVVKFFSKRCRACLRIAAKYRRLALQHKDEIDCYEAEFSVARPLLELLDVTQLPTIQVYGGEDIVRLYKCSCQPREFGKVEAKVERAVKLMRQRPGLALTLGEKLQEKLSKPQEERKTGLFDGGGAGI